MIEIQVLISGNASKFNSAEVQLQQIYRVKGIKRQFSSPGQQFQNGKAEKCIGDVWLMTKIILLTDYCFRVFQEFYSDCLCWTRTSRRSQMSKRISTTVIRDIEDILCSVLMDGLTH